MNQSTIIETILGDYPEKQRVFFVHIPKCAGTDFSVHLEKLYPIALHQTLSSPEWTPPEKLLEVISSVDMAAKTAPSILVYGHIWLRWIIDRELVRPGDNLFTIVREPAALLLSQVNYIAGSLIKDRKGIRPDTKQWLKRAGVGDVVGWPAADVATIAAKLTHKNPMCHALGTGTAKSALDAIRQSDIEITGTDRYSRWGEATWGVSFNTKYNVSQRIVERVPREAVEEACAEDILLYGAIMRAMNDNLKVRGGRV